MREVFGGLQTAHHIQPPDRPVIQPVAIAPQRCLRTDRNRDIPGAANLEAGKTCRCNPDYRDGLLVQDHFPAEYGSIAAEPALPEAVTDHRARQATAAPVIRRRKDPADERLDAEDLKKTAADEQAT